MVERLRQQGIIPWLDRHHYFLGTNPFEASHEGIMRNRHVACLVTPAAPDQGRGWTTLEKACAGLLQENLRGPELEFGCVELSLYFVPRDHVILPRSVWQSIADRWAFFVSPEQDQAVDWAALRIERFLRREQHRGLEVSERIV